MEVESEPSRSRVGSTVAPSREINAQRHDLPSPFAQGLELNDIYIVGERIHDRFEIVNADQTALLANKPGRVGQMAFEVRCITVPWSTVGFASTFTLLARCDFFPAGRVQSRSFSSFYYSTRKRLALEVCTIGVCAKILAISRILDRLLLAA